MVRFNKIQFSVSGQQSIPIGVFGSTAKEKPNPDSGQLHIGHCVIAVQTAAVFYGLPARKQFNKFSCTEQSFLEQIFGFGHFNHIQIVAGGVHGFDECHYVGACKTTYGEPIIKTYSLGDCVIYHVDVFQNLALGVLSNAIVYSLILTANI